ncbi:MAG: hypothetical protein WC332_00230 [Clostridia bacterium]|jgi:predicted YcjX-like family ATPase
MYKFTKTKDETNPHDIANIDVTIHNNEVSLAEILEAFSDFLRACGFGFKVTLDFIDDDEVA